MGIKNDFLAQPFWVPGNHVLYDYRETDFNNINLEQLRQMAAFHEANSVGIGGGRMAFLMGSPRDFGFARQYEMITEGKVLSEVRVFQEETQALEWLASHSGA